jgi:hypothetical protein
LEDDSDRHQLKFSNSLAEPTSIPSLRLVRGETAVRVVAVAAVIVDAITIGAGVTRTMAVRAQAVGLAEIISGGVLALLPLLSCLSDQSRSVLRHSAPTAMRCWQVFQKSNGQSLNSHFREWRQCAPA